MKPARIILVRHGQSLSNVDWSAHATTQDHLIPLTEEGRLQAVRAGRSINALMGVNERLAVYGSPFLRTRQTRDQILNWFQPRQIERVREDPRLREQEWGHFRTEEESKKIEAERDAYGTFYYRIPDGESGADVYDRCATFFDTLFRDFNNPDFPENLLIVSHGLTIRLFLMKWLHWSPEELEMKRNPHNCEIFVMLRQADGKYQLTEPFPLKPVPAQLPVSSTS